MNLRTKNPEWIRFSYAAKQINPNWTDKDLEEFIISRGYATKEQIFRSKGVGNVFKRRPDHELSDYSWDLLATSDLFIEEVKDLLQYEEAEKFYKDQYDYYVSIGQEPYKP